MRRAAITRVAAAESVGVYHAGLGSGRKGLTTRTTYSANSSPSARGPLSGAAKYESCARPPQLADEAEPRSGRGGTYQGLRGHPTPRQVIRGLRRTVGLRHAHVPHPLPRFLQGEDPLRGLRALRDGSRGHVEQQRGERERERRVATDAPRRPFMRRQAVGSRATVITTPLARGDRGRTLPLLAGDASRERRATAPSSGKRATISFSRGGVPPGPGRSNGPRDAALGYPAEFPACHPERARGPPRPWTSRHQAN